MQTELEVWFNWWAQWSNLAVGGKIRKSTNLSGVRRYVDRRASTLDGMVSVERHSVPSAVSCAPQADLSKDTVERSICSPTICIRSPPVSADDRQFEIPFVIDRLSFP